MAAATTTTRTPWCAAATASCRWTSTCRAVLPLRRRCSTEYCSCKTRSKEQTQSRDDAEAAAAARCRKKCPRTVDRFPRRAARRTHPGSEGVGLSRSRAHAARPSLPALRAAGRPVRRRLLDVWRQARRFRARGLVLRRGAASAFLRAQLAPAAALLLHGRFISGAAFAGRNLAG